MIIRNRRDACNRKPNERRKRGTVTFDIHKFTLINLACKGAGPSRTESQSRTLNTTLEKTFETRILS